MRRSFSARAVSLVFVSLVWLIPLAGADKSPKESGPAPADATAAEAREQVRQALLAETRGDNAERTRRLTQAWLSVPNLPEANWHMARVEVDDKWLPLAEAVNQALADPNLTKYRQLRDKATGNVKSLRDLARWCKKAGWIDVARLHYAQLLAIGAADMELQHEAVKELDLQQVGGQWLTTEEFTARQQGAQEIEAALEKWRPKLKKLQEAIDGDDFKRRDQAIDELNKIDDPTFIPVLESFLADGGDRFQEEAVKRLATFPHYEATQALVRYAVLSEFGIVRKATATALASRPLHEFVPMLIAGLESPIQSRFQVRWDKRGNISYTHAVFQEGPSHNMLLISHDLAILRNRVITLGPVIRQGQKGQPPPKDDPSPALAASRLETFRNQQASTIHEAASNEAQVRLANSRIQAANERILDALQWSTNEQSRQASQWRSWWQQYNEYSWPKPTNYIYQCNQQHYYATASSIQYQTVSCFLAGTPVRTQAGTVPIESIRLGDRVLAQDQDTGELAYKVVLRTTLRPPAKMVKIKVGDDEVVTTLGHPFWVSSQGWKMAKQLGEGDLLHSLGGAIRVDSVVPAGQKPAYNLVVDDFNTYFVGQAGLLVHDNEFRKPTRAVVPGLITD